jgi:uncharacterized protein
MNFPMKSFMVKRRQPATPVYGFWRKMPGSLRYWVIFFLVAGAFCAASGQGTDALFPPKPEPAVYVHDYAGWLSPAEKATLEHKLVRYHDSTSTQIVVMIRPDIGDYDKASYAFELGNRWGIGRKSKNNGIVMLVKSEPPDRGIFIATGYGAEGALPDITAGRIIRNTMAPYFRQQQYARGIEAGIDDIIRALSGEFKNDDKSDRKTPALAIVGIVLLILLLLILFIVWKARQGGTWYTHSGMGGSRRSARRHRDDDWGSGGWWIGGGGGGWSSGSGSGGGGWGGGGSFGGGSFGGGGAGGDW